MTPDFTERDPPSGPESTASFAWALAFRVLLNWGAYVLLVSTGYHLGEPLAGWMGALAWSAHVDQVGESLDRGRRDRGLLPLVDEANARMKRRRSP